jgi:hypothetical protein
MNIEIMDPYEDGETYQECEARLRPEIEAYDGDEVAWYIHKRELSENHALIVRMQAQVEELGHGRWSPIEHLWDPKPLAVLNRCDIDKILNRKTTDLLDSFIYRRIPSQGRTYSNYTSQMTDALVDYEIDRRFSR